MKQFLGEDFLLSNPTAVHLYESYAKEMPIFDYHCHISPMQIAEDHKFENITQLWLGQDHYKWRLMRANGVEETYITGSGSDWEKFFFWAKTLERAIGNPLYHWSHLELKRYFGYDGQLNSRTAHEVWELCNEALKSDSMSVKQLIKKSGVAYIGTTDDPADDLAFHRMIEKETDFATKVRPTFRPDKAMNLEKPDYLEYLNELTDVTGMAITDYDDLLDVIRERMDFFDDNGCRISDHALETVMYVPAKKKEIDEIFLKRMDEKTPTIEEQRKFKTHFMVEMGKEYARRNWVMQLHFGCKRNNNVRMFQKLGADSGYDSIGDQTSLAELADFLNALDLNNQLPKTILYSLNPNDDVAIGTIVGCFQDAGAAGKIQHGSGWWFNDHMTGMRAQMTSLANQGLLANFVGMLTDSRSFLSYTRHEYFRRIMCNMLGTWVENGEYPNDEDLLKEIIQGICYENAVRFFEDGK